MNSSSRTAHVLLPLPFGGGFDYKLPADTTYAIGDWVLVPFGRKEMAGVVWGEAQGGVDDSKLKEILSPLPHLSPMPPPMREFISWVARYTLSPIGAVLKMAMPPGKNSGSGVQESAKKRVAKKNSGQDVSAISLNPEPRIPNPPFLSAAQTVAATVLKQSLHAGFSATVLDGVTGSGKTEVYFDAIDAMLAKGGQVLVLLPEIALSVQWLARFEKRFGSAPEVWHSNITPSRKKKTWASVAHGDAKVVVGARSALFLPFKALALIVVDEEHEASYKQEEGVIYHARDMAVARAHIEKIPVLLVSATPSLETLQNIETGRYKQLHLPERHAGASLPAIKSVDMRQERLEPNQFIAPTLRRALAETLAQGHQAMLFLNRRGYAPLLLCRACGHRFRCEHCSAWLVLHKRPPRLQCHHCGHTQKVPLLCPACGAEDSLHPYGPGAERVADEVKQFLPQARVALMTSDHVSTHQQMQALVEGMEKGEIDILVGTQMMAKGHHFARLALVGVIDADLGLAGGDLRAGERTYQLLHQLSGRAGREDTPGEVWMQTYLPDHPVMQALKAGDRDGFMRLEAGWRKEAGMPPYGRLAALIIEGGDERQVADFARLLLRHAPQGPGLQVLGPAPAPIALLRGRYRYRLLVKSAKKTPLQAIVTGWLSQAEIPRTLRLKIDIDPYSFL